MRSWSESTIKIHSDSVIHREIFGKTKEEIIETLEESKKQMLTGLESLFRESIPEPIHELDLLFEQLKKELDIQILEQIQKANTKTKN